MSNKYLCLVTSGVIMICASVVLIVAAFLGQASCTGRRLSEFPSGGATLELLNIFERQIWSSGDIQRV